MKLLEHVKFYNELDVNYAQTKKKLIFLGTICSVCDFLERKEAFPHNEYICKTIQAFEMWTCHNKIKDNIVLYRIHKYMDLWNKIKIK